MENVSSSHRGTMPPVPNAATNVKPPTSDGIASGRTVRTDQTRRPGRSVRVKSHASGAEIAIEAKVTEDASSSVRKNTATVRGRATSSQKEPPACAERITKYATGSSIAAAIQRDGSVSQIGGRAKRARARAGRPRSFPSIAMDWFRSELNDYNTPTR